MNASGMSVVTSHLVIFACYLAVAFRLFFLELLRHVVSCIPSPSSLNISIAITIALAIPITLDRSRIVSCPADLLLV